jgi:predicted phage-related endonuclease
VYHWEASSQKMNSEEGNKLIDKCIQVYDELIELINNKEVELKKEHFSKIRTYLDEKTESIQKEIESLSN